jgi:hypothetical protein
MGTHGVLGVLAKLTGNSRCTPKALNGCSEEYPEEYYPHGVLAGTQGVLAGILQGFVGCSPGTQVYSGAVEGHSRQALRAERIPKGNEGVIEACSWGTSGYSRGSRGVVSGGTSGVHG